MALNPYLPHLATLLEVREETEDIKTFRLAFDDPEVSSAWQYLPGQIALLSLFGVGEAAFSLSSAPLGQGWLEFSIRRMGKVTTALHQLEPGAKVGIRGPFGRGFPCELFRGHDLLVIGGGIGMAPLRSLVNYVLARREDYGRLEIVYGARSSRQFCFREEIFFLWPQAPDTQVYLTIDCPEEGWEGHVGFVPDYVAELKPSPEGKYAVVCGPPIMIEKTIAWLEKQGFPPERIYTTLEMRMKCGIGKCGRCNLGAKFVCLSGPVFSWAELKEEKERF
ncbi:oxidoreductase FAD/NAD(P)-binding domain protein [Ammonifex degensii KC4]|uniref:Oxidoreductase FAD/NAD(P)-binding domain protein n=1 Tax=Ammonifex degensii (strain DSM 10501 / KC4) TaxID=429009 RepID=C9R807_AMMDK|nr:FAD/NAD(P)-binding protein [Ammonifex degensii]ACX52436.1 oxidoreductase FAD/NAD(P)-binding domain protein [Ammonifex degensii KC4]